MRNKLYGVRKLRTDVEIEVLGMKQDLSLSWWNGMIGAIPVFEDYEKALEYAEGNEYLIFNLTTELQNESN